MESDEGRENYTDDIIRLNKVAVVCKSKDIAAISYEPPSQAGDKDLRVSSHTYDVHSTHGV